jgi:polar amino acid transport system substrate-binding protein
MKKTVLLFTLTLALGLLIGAGYTGQAAAAEKTITVATDATWPPMEMVDAKKNIVGFDIDYMNAIAKAAGFKVVYKNTAWDGIFAGVGAGKYDAIISSVTITPERQKEYDFSDPYTAVGQILVVPKAFKGKTLADLKGKKVGAQIGTTGAFEVKKVEGVELKTYDEVGLAFADMAAGRIEGVVCDNPTAANFALQNKDYKSKFKIVGSPFTQENYGIVVKKGNKELVDLFNKGIKAVKAKGLDKQFEKKWLR